MTTPTLSDLRYLFYGGGSAAEYDYLLQAQAAGVSASSVIRKGYSGNGSPEGVVTAPVGSSYTDNTNGDTWNKTAGVGNVGWAKLDSSADPAFLGFADHAVEHGFTIDADTNLYRSAAGILKSDGYIYAGNDFVARVGLAQQVFVGSVSALPGIILGSLADTNLYRSAADTLKTDDAFISVLDVTARVGAATTVIMGSVAGLAGFFIGADCAIYRSAADQITFPDAIKFNSGSLAGATNAGPNLFGGTGAPNNANGANGDVYFRLDSGAGTSMYVKRAGAWVAGGP